MLLNALNYKAVFDKQLLILFFAQQDKIFYLGRHLARKVIVIVKLIRIEILYQKRPRRRNHTPARIRLNRKQVPTFLMAV